MHYDAVHVACTGVNQVCDDGVSVALGGSSGPDLANAAAPATSVIGRAIP